MAAICGLFASTAVQAQPGIAPVQKIDGRKYYLHTVQPGNSLWSIAKMYAIHVSHLQQENPDISSILQIGQQLKVPIDAINRKESKNPPAADGDFLVHKVAKKETLYGIAKRYKVSNAELNKVNPDLTIPIQIGQKIRIPVTKAEIEDSTMTIPARPRRNGYYHHVVQAGETVYGLAQKHKISPDSLMALNPAISQKGLAAGDVLKVPVFTTTAVNDQDTAKSNPPIRFVQTETCKVALMLPFYAERNKKIKANKNPWASKEIYGNSLNALDFYNGVLLALDSLKSTGMNIELLVFDTNPDSSTIDKTLTDPRLKSVHLIIGPFYAGNVKKVSRFAKTNGIHLVAPVLQKNRPLLGHPNMSKVRASHHTQVSFLGKYCATHHQQDNVVLVQSVLPRHNDDALIRIFEDAYNGNINGIDSLQKGTTEANGIQALSSLFKANQLNVLVLPSQHQAFVNHFFTMLAGLHETTFKDYRFRIYGIDRWEDFDGIDIGYKHTYNLHITKSLHANFNSKRLMAFTRYYHHRNEGIDPGAYSLLGFDIGYYYLKGLQHYGTAFFSSFPKIDYEPMITRFSMQQMGKEHGFENYSVFLMKYEDYQLKKAGE